ncbi:MAG TPA: type II toxin-antitoxin system RelE/ParE family toxin [Variovorax sp.]
MKVAFTDEAQRDLIEIGDRIACDSPRRALTFVAELRAASAGLANNPLRFQLVDRHEDGDVRRRPHGNYLIFYRVRGDTVEVLRVLHGARDYEALLFPGEPRE